MNKRFQQIYYTILFYGSVLLLPFSPGTLAWILFRNRKGKIPFIKRDLICDTDTLYTLPKSDNSLDEFTTAFSPFIPLLTLNGNSWKLRRKLLAEGLHKINVDMNFNFELPFKKGDVYWDFFEKLFIIGFELIFGRPPTQPEFDEMYPGVADVNRLIKRQTGHPDNDVRWKLYHSMLTLLSQENPQFIYHNSAEFKNLTEIDKISLVVEDLLISICIQCTDLICHLLLLYSEFKDPFKTHLDNCISETLRLYPLTDIWTRKQNGSERGWIASLVQLNRNGWEEPDTFKPERWHSNNHPPLISWGFDSRSCPASRIGYNLSKKIFEKVLVNDTIWLSPASNFKHTRTFTSGCQLWIGEGSKPTSLKWNYKGKWKKGFLQWLSSRQRVLDQHELW